MSANLPAFDLLNTFHKVMVVFGDGTHVDLCLGSGVK